MGWFNKREFDRSYQAGWGQREADNEAGGVLRGREVSGGPSGRVARDEQAFTWGYQDAGENEAPGPFDWM